MAAWGPQIEAPWMRGPRHAYENCDLNNAFWWTWNIANKHSGSSVIVALQQCLLIAALFVYKRRHRAKEFNRILYTVYTLYCIFNVRSSFEITWTFGYKSVSAYEIESLSELINCKFGWLHCTTHLSTYSGISFEYGKSKLVFKFVPTIEADEAIALSYFLGEKR
jgi:hypothetical protein